MGEIPGIPEMWEWLGSVALAIFLLGLLGTAVWNTRTWLRDRARLGKLRTQTPSVERLSATPKVSVLVAAWNEADSIREHIESFRALRYPDKRLILCAGGEDGTYEIAERYAGDDVVVLRQRPGEGKQRALQHCFDQEGQDIVFLTDADCVFTDEAFERIVGPIVNGEEAVTTGASAPLESQKGRPFVRHQWLVDLYFQGRRTKYVRGLFGRNAALRWDVLRDAGEFKDDIPIGVDNYLGRRTMALGHRIRYVRDSVVPTRYAERLGDYWTQQTRWLRLVTIYGVRFRGRKDLRRAIGPQVVGILLFAGIALGVWLGWLVFAVVAVLWIHLIIRRLRYVRFGELWSGQRVPLGDYLRLPGYLVMDMGVCATAPMQYLSKQWRAAW